MCSSMRRGRPGLPRRCASPRWPSSTASSSRRIPRPRSTGISCWRCRAAPMGSSSHGGPDTDPLAHGLFQRSSRAARRIFAYRRRSGLRSRTRLGFRRPVPGVGLPRSDADRFHHRPRPLPPLAARFRGAGRDTDARRRSGGRAVSRHRAEAQFLRSRRRYRIGRRGHPAALRAPGGARRRDPLRQAERVLRRRQYRRTGPREPRAQGQFLQVHQRDAAGDRGRLGAFRRSVISAR